jgi:hypothetical protein
MPELVLPPEGGALSAAPHRADIAVGARARMVALCRPGRADSGVANVAARTVANANNDADGWYKGNY